MYTSMKFSDSDSKQQIDFSEVVNKNQMFIYGYGNGNDVLITLNEKEIRELRKWLTSQIRKLSIPLINKK